MQLVEQSGLAGGFNRFFSVQPAISTSLRDEVFRIRHEVYCEELRFEPVRPDGREADEYDAQSLHCLMWTSMPPKQPVGCTRLVLTDPSDRDAPLPFELTCAATLDRSIVDPRRLPRDRIAEVSRLAVRAPYRRRRGEKNTPLPLHGTDFGMSRRPSAHAPAAHPRFPYIPIGLYLGAVALAARAGIDTLFLLTEPRLAAHFGKLGVDVRQIGDPVEHRGARIPSMIDVQGVIATMRPLVRPIWEVIQAEIDAGLGRPDQ